MKSDARAVLLAEAVTASQHGDLAAVQRLVGGLPGQLPPNEVSAGITCLHWASINGRESIVRYLLEQGARVDLVGGPLRENALHWAAREGRLSVMLMLLGWERTAPSIAEQVLVPNTQGQTALHLAAQAGHSAAVLCLLAHGSPPNSLDVGRYSPLMLACKSGKITVDIMRTLLSFGAHNSLSEMDDEDGNTALHWALAANSGPGIVGGLVRAGAPLKVKNKLGLTADEFARSMGMHNPARFIVDVGKEPRHVSELPLVRGFLILPVVLGWVFACLSLLSFWGILLGIVGAVVIIRSCFDIVAHKQSLVGLGWTVGSVIIIWFSHVAMVWPHRPWWEGMTVTAFVLSTLSFMWATFRADPGHIARTDNVSRDIKLQTLLRASVDEAKDDKSAGEAALKEVCLTCLVKKEPRSKHCEACQACIQRFDHHVRHVHGPALPVCICISRLHPLYFFVLFCSAHLLEIVWAGRTIAFSSYFWCLPLLECCFSWGARARMRWT
jgi:ankyrin repeat protein